MATIKIDRGFTQKIQQKGLLQTPSSMPPQPPPKSPKGPKGPQKRMIFAVVGAVGVLVAMGLGISASRGSKKSAAPTAAPQQANIAKTPAPAAPESVKPTQEQTTGQPPETQSAPQTESQNAQNQQQQTPLMREIPLGSPQGLLCEYYEGIPEQPIRALLSAPTFPGRPSRTVQIRRFELQDNNGDDYGVRVRGYLVPTQSGKYRFAVCVDDSAEFWLSTDDTPTNLRKLITLDSLVETWDYRTDLLSEACELVAGKRYYVEALMKEGNGFDYLRVGWAVPGSDQPVIIDAPFLRPWVDSPTAAQAATANTQVTTTEATEGEKPKNALPSALAPARAAVEEQQRLNGAAYRYAEASQILKAKRTNWQDPEAKDLIDTAILRFETLARLREFVQAELARAPIRGIWVAFGGQVDVTGANDEGVTVAPGRIVSWEKIPPDQMLRLINATVPKATGDAATKGTLFLAAAVFCKEVTGGVDLALKYRDRALAANSRLEHLAEIVLGGTPEKILAEARSQSARMELARLSASATGLAEKATKRQADLAPVTGLVPGLSVEYWENARFGSLNEARQQGFLNKSPDSSQTIENFDVPENRSHFYIARVRGFLTPSVTGEYTFYIACDDQGEFWLSSDDTPAKLALCINLDSYVVPKSWDKDTRKSMPVSLVKGRYYSVEAFLKDNEGEDHLSVAWSLPKDDNPKLITAANLLHSDTVGYTPRVQEIRNQLDEDLQKILTLTTEVAQLREANGEPSDSSVPVTTEQANALQKQADRAKEALREAEGLLQRVDTTMPQIKVARRPEKAKR